jgi:hypothetical protein
MSDVPTNADVNEEITTPRGEGWQELWSKEDWWAVWLGLGIVILACALFHAGSTFFSWIAVAPAKWSTFPQLEDHFSKSAGRYAAQFGAFLILFTIATSFIGQKAKAFIPSFLFIYIVSLVIIAAGNWDQANRYNLEPPLLGLLLGLIISNVSGLPRWLDAGFRVEFYIKLGIVLLGATLPFTLIIWAGPVAILQSFSSWRGNSVLTPAFRQRSAQAARSAESRRPSPWPVRCARKKSILPSPSAWWFSMPSFSSLHFRSFHERCICPQESAAHGSVLRNLPMQRVSRRPNPTVTWPDTIPASPVPPSKPLPRTP